MDSNDKFRQRIVPDPDHLARADRAVERVRAALQTAVANPTVRSVTEALRAGGFTNGYGVEPFDVVGVPSGAVGVAIGFESACVYGHVSSTEVVLETGGVTNEGSCLAGVGGH